MDQPSTLTGVSELTHEEFIDYLSSHGFFLRVASGKLRCISFGGNRLTDELRNEINSRQPDIAVAVSRRRLPLSFAQESLWFLDHSSNDPGAAYNVPLVIELNGTLKVEALERALNQLISRHEILRTVIKNESGSPWQEIGEPYQFDLNIEPTSEEQLHDVLMTEARHRFDLQAGPLIRFRLFYLTENKHILLVNQHHIINDGWSIILLKREISPLYTAFATDTEPDLPPQVFQYSDSVLWQRERFTEDYLESLSSYWRSKLKDYSTLSLPTDRVRPPIQTFSGKVHNFQIERQLAEDLKSLSKQTRSTLFTVLLSAFNVLLSRYADQTDIIIGSPFANRTQKEFECIFGLFTNMLPLRTDLSGDPSFLELHQQVANTCLDAASHQEIPFDHIVKTAELQRDPGRSPIFQVAFVFLEEKDFFRLFLPDVDTKISFLDNNTSKLDLTLTFIHTEAGLQGSIEYNTDLFNDGTIERMVRHLDELLKDIVTGPQRSIHSLRMLTDEEEQQILLDWSGTDVAYPENQTFQQLFEEQVLKTPDNKAVVFRDQWLSYRELNRRANQLAHFLRATDSRCTGQGLTPGTLVGICLNRSLETIVAILGTLKAGGAFVPLDPQYPQPRLEHMIEGAKVPIVLTQRSTLNRLPFLSGGNRRIVCLDSEWELIQQFDDGNAYNVNAPEDLAYVIYTSGSTDKPKGVMIEHTSLVNLAVDHVDRFNISEDSRVLQYISLNFDASLSEIAPTLISGGCLYLITQDLALSLHDLCSFIIRNQITVVTFPPTVLNQLPRGYDLPVKTIVVGSEVCDADSLNFWSKDRLLVNAYGPTEATVAASAFVYKPGEPQTVIGFPINNVRLYILDSHLNPVPAGVPGELFIGGVGLARGYLNSTELDQQLFLENPFAAKEAKRQGNIARIYRTGDRARWRSDGSVEFLGRLDQQTKVRSFRVELPEIERAIQRLPFIKHCVVIAVERHGSKQLAAYYIKANNSAGEYSTHSEDLRNYLNTQLPSYMVPSFFIELKAMPLTPSGKVDRNALPEPYLHDVRSSDEIAHPRTQEEKLIKEIWQSVLHVDEVSIFDNFFSLGGDSILSIQVVSRAHAIGLNLNTTMLFANPTVAGLAAQAKKADKAVATEQESVKGAATLLPIQLWFFEQGHAVINHYNQAFLFKAKLQFDREALRRSLHLLVEHHDSLRLRFHQTPEGRWEQNYVETEGAFEIPVDDIDLTAIGEDAASDFIMTCCNIAQGSLDLEHGPLIRASIFNGCKDGRQRLFICIHHLLIDTISWRILLEDLRKVYASVVSALPVDLGRKTDSYRAWGQGLLRYLESKALQSQWDYWLTGGEQAPSIPFDFQAGEAVVGHRERQQTRLGPDETQSLLKRSHSAYNTRINDLLLTALALASYDITEQPNLFVNLEAHGRKDCIVESDVSRTVGCFTSIFPVHLRLPPPAETGTSNSLYLEASIKHIKEQLHRIPDNGIGYGVLRYLSDDKRSGRLALRPSPKISFNYLGQLDSTFNDEDFLSVSSESVGLSVSPDNKETHLIDVIAMVMNRSLEVFFDYSSRHYSETTIKNLASRFRHRLQQIVEHCTRQEAPCYTPSDFPLARLTQSQLDRLASKHRIEAIYPLSPLQEGLLFQSLLAPESGEYSLQVAWRHERLRNVEAYKQAWAEIIKHHPVLRTAFEWEELAAPVQIVERAAELVWLIEDWQDDDEATQDQKLTAYLQKDRLQGFDLGSPPLMRVHLIRLGKETYTVVWTHHHLLTDGWCMHIILEELAMRYQSLDQARYVHFISPPPYEHYIAWVQAQDKEDAETFWRNELAGFDTPTPLNINQGKKLDIHEAIADFRESETLYSLDFSRQCAQFARQNHITLNTLIEMAWAIVLSNYSGHKDVVFGIIVSGRPAKLPQVESMVGLFINSLPLRIQFDASLNCREALLQLNERTQLLQNYSYSSLNEIQNYISFTPGDPLFYSLLIFENYPSARKVADDLTLLFDGLRISEKTNYPLNIVIVPGDQILVKVLYNGEAFDERIIRSLTSHLRQVISWIIQHPEQVPGKAEVLTPEEKQIILADWNRSEVPFPSDKTLHQLFELQAAKSPELPAIAHGDQVLSYGLLDNRANQLAIKLRKEFTEKSGEQIKPDTMIGLCVERGPEMIIGLLGILKAGAAFLPLDPDYPRARLEFILQDTQAPMVVTQSSILKDYPFITECGRVAICLDLKQGDHYQESDIESSQTCNPTNLAYIMYTSGSTGMPKGAMCTHRGVINFLHDWQNKAPLQSGSRTTFTTKLAFDVSVYEIFSALLFGGCVHVVDKDLIIDADRFSDYLIKQSINGCYIPPHLVGDVARLISRDPRKFSLVRVMVGVEPPREQDMLMIKNSISGVSVINGYGTTETSIGSISYYIEEATGRQGFAPIGRPFQNQKGYVLDDGMNLAPVGVPGEIYIGGEGVSRGYLNQPALTAERFLPNPFVTSEELAEGRNLRIYRTGDIGYWSPAGIMHCLGRSDSQIKIRGFRVELGEVESAIISHPAISQSLVLLHSGGGKKHLVAYCQKADPNLALRRAELRDYLLGFLPDYSVPSVYIFLESFPLTPNGKLDRKALPAPSLYDIAVENEYVGSRTENELVLQQVWQTVLQIPRIGVDDNFFSLGGDSIMSIQVIARARHAGVNVTVKQLLSHPTIAGLAACADTSETIIAAEQDLCAGAVDLIPIQQWYFQQEQPDSHHWNQAFLFMLTEPVSPVDVTQAIRALAIHHDALRLRFSKDEHGGWVQSYINTGEVFEIPLDRIDLRPVAVHDQDLFINEKCAELQTLLNIVSGPIMRACLFEGHSDGRQRLFMCIHHLVIDGVSWRILSEDLRRVLLQIRNHEPVQLPAKTNSYKEWGKALLKYLDFSAQQQWDYWLNVVRMEPPPIKIDPGEAHPLVKDMAHQVLTLTQEQTQSLRTAAATAYGAGVDDLLLTALALAVKSWTGQDDLLLHLEGHGREHCVEGVDVSRTLGLFTSLFPAHLKLPTTESPEDAATPTDEYLSASIKLIKEQLRRIPDKGIGYGLLKYLTADIRSLELQRLDRASIGFNYLGYLDQMITVGGVFESAQPFTIGPVSPINKAYHPLEINALVNNDRLEVFLSYSTKHFDEAAIRKLAGELRRYLAEIIRHCLRFDTRSFTPSDFPLAALSQKALDAITDGAQVESVYALTPLQEGLLFHGLHAPESDQYFTQLSWRYQGTLDKEACIRACEAVVADYGIYRTAFVWEGLEKPVQVVHKHINLDLYEEDWSNDSQEEQQRKLARYFEQDRERPYDLKKPPLFRLHLLRVGENDNIILWSIHHIICDGWSLAIAFEEVNKRYQSIVNNNPFMRPPPPPFENYIAWLQEKRKASTWQFWKDLLKDFDSPTPLRVNSGPPLDIHKPITNFAQEVHEFPEDFTEKCTEFTRKHRITFNTLISTAWAVVLSRYSGRPDVVFGLTVSGRPSELSHVEEMVGIFINTLPLRVRFDERKSILQHLWEVLETVQKLNQHSYATLIELQGLSALNSQSPLFYTLFVHENFPAKWLSRDASSGTRVSPYRSYEKTNYPLTLIAVPPDRGGFLQASFDADCFSRKLIRNLLNHILNVVSQICDNPGAKIGQLDLLTPVEREQLLSGLDTATPLNPEQQTCIDLFQEQAEQAPDRIALVFEDQSLTYGELNQRVNRLTRYLQRFGLAPGQIAAISLEKSVEMVVSVLAVMKAGAAYLPLDPSYPENRLQFMLEDSQAYLLITSSQLAKRFHGHCKRIVQMDRAAEMIRKESGDDQPSGSSFDGLAYIIYTSGSTGRAKGAMITHNSLASMYLAWERSYGLSRMNCSLLQMASFSFDVFTGDLVRALCSGGKLVLCPSQLLLQPEGLYALMHRHNINCAEFVPSVLSSLCDYISECGLDLKFMRLLMSSSDTWVSKEYARCRALCDEDTRIINSYGLTEVTIDSTYFESSQFPLESFGPEKSVPIGQPFANNRVFVLDCDLHPVPIGIPGELYLGGEGLAVGYWGRPDLTAIRFIPNPFSDIPGDRLYKTGDNVRWSEEGFLDYLGRSDHQVNINGVRIELGEIESYLRQYAGIRQCAVNDYNIEGQKRLAAYYVADRSKPFHRLSTKDKGEHLRNYLRKFLPDMITPAAFIELDALPFNANGKVDRGSLPAPTIDKLLPKAEQVEPRTDVEKILAEIWQKVLKLERVSINGNFFNLGGDSILVIQVVSRARQAGLNLTPKEIFGFPTIAQLADKLGSKQKQTAVNSKTSTIWLTPFQQEVLQLEDLTSPAAVQVRILKMKERMEKGRLRSSLLALLNYHDALRLKCIRTQDGIWRQALEDSKTSFRLESFDLSAIQPERQEAVIQEQIIKLQKSLDPAAGRLLLAELLTGHTDGQDRLVLLAHSLIVDSPSWRVLLEDFETAYAQASDGKEVRLTAERASFQYWTNTLSQRAKEKALSLQLLYWLTVGQDVPALPMDELSDTALAEPSSNRTAILLDCSLTQALIEAKARGIQAEEVLLGGLALAVDQTWKRSEFLVQLKSNARRNSLMMDLSKAVGCYSFVFPAHLRLPKSANGKLDGAYLGATLTAIKAQLSKIPDYGIGYGLLRYADDNNHLQEMRAQHKAQIGFEYLGRDAAIGGNDFFEIASEESALALPSVNSADVGINITCQIVNDILEINVNYNSRYFQPNRVECFARAYKSALSSLIEYCSSLPFLSQELRPEPVARRKDLLGIYEPMLGFNENGERPPLFFVHPGGAGSEIYIAFANRLDKSQPFYSIENYNMYSNRPPIESLEGLASLYAHYIQEVEPEGPYYLGGWSLGGLIAYEIAQQLTQQGRIVNKVFLLDTPLMTDEEKSFTRKAVEKSRGNNAIDHETLLRLVMKATVDYEDKLRPYDRAIILFKAKDADYQSLANALEKEWMGDRPAPPRFDNGWGQFAASLEIKPVEGNHLSMMRGTNLPNLARLVQEELLKDQRVLRGDNS